jgi:CxxC motif-containing protein (DUF1111 family)
MAWGERCDGGINAGGQVFGEGGIPQGACRNERNCVPNLQNGVVHVPAYTDLKLHDITCGPDDPNRDALDLHRPPTSPAFTAGNGRFLTKKLWGFANEPPFFHHGQFTTIREAILAHCGEARAAREAFQALGAYGQATVIEFLKTLQVLPPGTRRLVLSESGPDEGE